MSEQAPSPSALYKRTGGGDAYRVAMLEHGYIQLVAPWQLKPQSDKRVLQCGLTHEYNWSEWRRYSHGRREYEGRWCQTCATTQVREVSTPAATQEQEGGGA